ncbi:hypothetical protein K469DRAFT_734765 [Zopfia rhizophila CBS 207.26]|uniref:Thioesterase/thiol ester dehydrase-isomerase n=1 Tax=Zopfia rhizophila CBS 207.26 TaxID=1314779 RepID=A0A6A6EQ91_9PEZI|nr:hypothetical protein K469DRAFT_734765 [Zopfia rhizophila CBS 207.26]
MREGFSRDGQNSLARQPSVPSSLHHNLLRKCRQQNRPKEYSKQANIRKWLRISSPPEKKKGNTLNIAYKGFALALAAKGACKTVLSGYPMYSMPGHYLGLSLPDRTLHCSVRTARQTRTFARRNVEVSQVQDDDSKRLCLVALVDFQVAESASLLTYSVSPYKFTRISRPRKWTRATSQICFDGESVAPGCSRLDECFWSTGPPIRRCVTKHDSNTQDHLPLAEKSTADWLRACEIFMEEEDQYLREVRTKIGAEGRTYSETRLWDERGACVASMTQQSIPRPKAEKMGKL